MVLEYQKNELRCADNFNTIYNSLKNDRTVLLASSAPLRTARDYAFAATIEFGNGYFCWEHYGSSAEKATKRDLRFLFAKIFDDCDCFTLVDAETYYSQKYAYYDAQMKKWR